MPLSRLLAVERFDGAAVLSPEHLADAADSSIDHIVHLIIRQTGVHGKSNQRLSGSHRVVRTAVRKTDPRSMWVNDHRVRRGHNRATVAVADREMGRQSRTDTRKP